jgi:hypothetical protein
MWIFVFIDFSFLIFPVNPNSRLPLEAIPGNGGRDKKFRQSFPRTGRLSTAK